MKGERERDRQRKEKRIKMLFLKFIIFSSKLLKRVVRDVFFFFYFSISFFFCSYSVFSLMRFFSFVSLRLFNIRLRSAMVIKRARQGQEGEKGAFRLDF